MPWIPHIMVLDDDPRVLESLVPGFVTELGRALTQSERVCSMLRRGVSGAAAEGPIRVQVSAHGFEGKRLASLRTRKPFEVHLHLVRETGGTFDEARRLLNQQLFAVVVSDLRFSDDAGGQRAGQLFVNEAERVHPELEGLLYSAYPKPEDFPEDRFIRKGESGDGGALVRHLVAAVERHVERPAVAAFAEALGELGLVYQSEAFGRTLAQLFDLARLIGSNSGSNGPARGRRPLPCLLIDGESGTGKRGLAELFHAASDRRDEPLVIASCSELTNETLLRGILFGHKRGAFTDAKEDRAGLVSAAGRGVVLLDDVHRLPGSCSAILHSFLEDGDYGRLGEEETRKRAEAAVVLTVETGPWRDRRRAGELPLAFLARVERLLVEVPPLRERPEDIEAQAVALTHWLSEEVGAELELDPEALQRLQTQPFAESNSRELRNVVERAVFAHYRETDRLGWVHLEPYVTTSAEERRGGGAASSEASLGSEPTAVAGRGSGRPKPGPALNDWQRRLRALAGKILAKGTELSPEEAHAAAEDLFENAFPRAWDAVETSRRWRDDYPPIPLAVWEDLWRCFAVNWLGGPTPAEKELGIPANTLRQWINDRESR